MGEIAIPLLPDNIPGLEILFKNRPFSDRKSELEKEQFVLGTLATALRTALINPQNPKDENNRQVSFKEVDFIRDQFLKQYDPVLKKYPSFYSFFNNPLFLDSKNGQFFATSLEKVAAELEKDVERANIEKAFQKYRSMPHRYFFRSKKFPPLPDFFESIPDHPFKLRKIVEDSILRAEEYLGAVLANEDLLNSKNPRRFQDALKLLEYYQQYQFYFNFSQSIARFIPGVTGLLRIEGVKLQEEFYIPFYKLTESEYSPAIYKVIEKISGILKERYPHIENDPTQLEIRENSSVQFSELHERTRVKILYQWLKNEKSFLVDNGAHISDLEKRKKLSELQHQLRLKSEKFRNNALTYPIVHLTFQQLRGLGKKKSDNLLEKSDKTALTDDDLEDLQLSDDPSIREQAYYLLTGNYDRLEKMSKSRRTILTENQIQKIKIEKAENWKLFQEILELENQVAILFGKKHYGEVELANEDIFKDFPDFEKFLNNMLKLSVLFYKKERADLKEAKNVWDIPWAAEKISETNRQTSSEKITPEESQKRIDDFYRRYGKVYIKNEKDSGIPYFVQRKIVVFDVYSEDQKTKKRKFEGKEIRDLYTIPDENGFTKDPSPRMTPIWSWKQNHNIYPLGTLVMNFPFSDETPIYLNARQRATHRHESGHIDEQIIGKFTSSAYEWMSTNFESRYSMNESSTQMNKLQPKLGDAFYIYLLSTIKGMIWNESRKHRSLSQEAILNIVKDKLRSVGIDEPEIFGKDFIAAEFHMGKQDAYGLKYLPGDLINLYNQTLPDDLFFKVFREMGRRAPFNQSIFKRYKAALKVHAPEKLPIQSFGDIVKQVIDWVKKN